MTLAATVAAVGCGDDGGNTVDATPVIDVDNGSCGDQLRFTGELLDWDAHTSFCGVFDAAFEVQGDGGMDTTAPNGRFDLCIPDRGEVLLDIKPAAANSGCTTPPVRYAVPGIAVASRDVIRAGGMWSGRLFGVDRVPADLTKAQVVVHVNGTPRAVSLGAAHAAPQAVNGATWAAGDTGSVVYFPDVDPAGGTTTLQLAGGMIGPASIPLVAGTVTNVSVIAN